MTDFDKEMRVLRYHRKLVRLCRQIAASGSTAPATKTPEAERQKFEKWARVEFEYKPHQIFSFYEKGSRKTGQYVNEQIQHAWMAWQARAAVESDTRRRMHSDRELGWKRIWVLCYRANNGEWYPIKSILYPLKKLAEKARKAYPAGVAKYYKAMPYERAR